MIEKEAILASASILNGYPMLFLLGVMLVGVGVLVYYMGRSMMNLLRDMLTNIETKLTNHIDDEMEFKREVEKRLLTLEIKSKE
jgi:hypothetical protein